MNPMDVMSNMNPKYPTQYNNQPFLNQLPPFKREPAKEMMAPNYQRHQPTYIFKYFSPNYDEKLWHY